MDELIDKLKEGRYLINISQLERESGLNNFVIHNCIKGRGCKQFKKNSEIIKAVLQKHGIFL